MVFQELAAKRMGWLWRRLVAPGTLLVGTDRRLLVIREVEKLREPRYGHAALSLPRRWVASLAIRDEGNWLSLEYAPDPAVLSLPVATAHAPALRALVAALQSDAPDGFGEDALAQAF
jgi:hypothetical protein